MPARIPDLPAIAGASTANDDNLVIFDTTADTTKRILRSELAAGLVGDLPYTPSGFVSATTVPTAIAEITSDLTAASGSSLIGYLAAGSGASPTDVRTKLRESVSVTDFGAVGDGVTDDVVAVQAAIDALPAVGGALHFPATTLARYNVSSKPTTGAKRIVFVYHGPAEFTNTANYPNGTNIFGFYQAGTETSFQETRIIGDTVDQTAIAGSKVNGQKVFHQFGDAATTGGRHAVYGLLLQNAVTSGANTDRNYIGIQGQCITSTGDGGTNITSGAKGAYFGISSIVNANSGATNLFNITGAEINTRCLTGSSVFYKSVIQLVAKDEIQGDTYDTVLAISKGGSGTVGLKTGILFGNMNGSHPVSTSGTLIATTGSSTVATGIDFTTYAFTDAVLKAPLLVLRSNALQLSGVNTGVELGSLISANTPSLDFHSSGNNIDFDSRIVASGGTTSIGAGILTYIAQVHTFNTSAAGVVGNQFRIGHNPGAVNYVQVIGALTASTSPQVMAEGPDTDIDLRLTPKGVGNVRFGVFTSSADAPIDGYITIKDFAGNVRKLATIA